MDHIEPPHGTNHLIVIPYVCNTRFTFDDGDLFTYPVRCGMVTLQPLSSTKDVGEALTEVLRDPSLTIDDLAPFLQAWLYFGSLHYIFKDLIKADYRPSDFIKEEPAGQVVVTTQYLFDYILCWAAFESTIPEDVDFGLAKVSTLLHIVADTITLLADPARLKTGPVDECDSQMDERKSSGHLVFLSIVMLFEVLEEAGKLIYGHFPNIFPGPLAPCSGILKTGLTSAGWCPSEITMLQHTTGIAHTTVYFLTMVDRKSLQKDHSRCKANANCTAYEVNYDTYKTKHVHPGCVCAFLPPVASSAHLSVSWIWDSGGIPLLTYQKEGNDRASVNVRFCPRNDSTDIPRYAAISHVWSDGLGNQEENSLPICVLEQIQARVNRLFEPTLWPVPFWIDTICVPKANKLPALEAMHDTYKKADIVLVLDASLEATSVHARPQEKLLRIALSPWMHRLWTFQEAWATLNLAFQFREAANSGMGLVEECICSPNRLKFSPEDFETRKKTSPLAKFANRIARAFGVDYRCDELGAFDWEDRTFLETRDLFKQRLAEMIPGYPHDSDIRLANFIRQSHMMDLTFDHRSSSLMALIQASWRMNLTMGERIAAVFTGLRHRTTSRKEDEFYCLANLSDVPVAPILSVRTEDRMEKLLASMKVIPSSILFSIGVPRLKADHMTWAPISFLEAAHGHYSSGTGLATIQDKELRVMSPGMRIMRTTLDTDRAKYAPAAPPSSKRVSMSGRRYTEPIDFQVSDPQDHWIYRLLLPADNYSHETWETYRRTDLMVILSSSFNPAQEHLADGTVVAGALVAQLEAGSDAARVRYLEPIYMKRMSWEKTKPARGCGYYEAEWVGDDHLWCIV